MAALEQQLQQCRQAEGGTAATTCSIHSAAETAEASPAAAVAVGAEAGAVQLLEGGSEEGEGGGARKRARREQGVRGVGPAVTGEAGEGGKKLPLPFSGLKTQPPRVPQPVSLLHHGTTSEAKHQQSVEAKEMVGGGQAQEHGHDEKAVGRAEAEGGGRRGGQGRGG